MNQLLVVEMAPPGRGFSTVRIAHSTRKARWLHVGANADSVADSISSTDPL